MTSKPDLDALLNQTSFGLDVLTMLGDVGDFIEFSESNIGWQKHQELRRAEQECAGAFDDPIDQAQYRDQTLEGVEYRFEVSLKQRVRYAALVALITTIEWTLLALKRRASFGFPTRPEKKSEAVHILCVLNEKATLNLQPAIELLEVLVHIRNCIVHAAGLLDSYRFESELREKLMALPGVKVSNQNFLGDSIEIETGFLKRVIEDFKRWLPDMEKKIFEQGLLTQ